MDFLQVFEVFRKESSLFKGRPMLWLAALMVILIPSLYTVIYLGAVWDPYEKLDELPAGLVMLDEGVDYKGKRYDLGRELEKELREKRPFRFIEYAGEKECEAGVRKGEVYFGLVVPRDFSAKALPGTEAGTLTLVSSQGTSFISTLIAQRFVDKTAKALNDEICLRRWQAVLTSKKDARSAVVKLRDGAKSALEGTKALEAGLTKASEGADEIAENQKTLAGGLSGIDTEKLAAAGKELHENTEKLANGLAEHIILGTLIELPFGLPPAKDLKKLAEGAEEYQAKIEELAAGIGKAAAGAGTLAEKDEELVSGLKKLQEGSAALTQGLEKIYEGLKLFAEEVSPGKEKAKDLAVPVKTDRTELAPISSNGQGFAPYFMSLSLWLGVIISAFLFRLVVFPVSLREKNNIAKTVGKGLLPLSLSLSGALFLGLTVQLILGIRVLHPAGYYAVLLVSALTYSTIILAFVRLIGEAGKLLAIIFLVVEIASAAGAYPIELSPKFYQVISPYLPLTFTVEGLRAAMFGSYDGGWPARIVTMLPWIAFALAGSCLSARKFRYVEESQYGPALDLSGKK
jgi:putative membrane protein